MSDPDRQPGGLEEDLSSADDAVIGRALRRSLLALAVLAAIAGTVLFFARRPTEAPPETVIETRAPVAVTREVAPPAVTFTDITAEAGIDFEHFNGAEGEKLLPETMGSGATFFDFDNDLDQDLLLVNATFWPHGRRRSPAPSSALYLNDGAGGFQDVSARVGLTQSVYGTGVAVGDFDGDGWNDVFLATVGPDLLLRNDEGRLRDVTSRAGVAGGPQDWSSSAAFVDFDRDGDLDLFVCRYVRWSREIDFEIDYRLTGVGRAYGPPTNFEGTFSRLFRNEGDGTFSEVSAESGIEVRNPATGVPVGKALGLLPVDVDEDGWIDLLVANDTVRNFFFHNRGDGTFEEVGELWGLAYGRNGEATGAMGVDGGHYRNNRDLGFAIGNFANEMTSLYTSQGDPTLYADEAIGEGVGAPSRLMLSFGILLFDYDLDGRLDMLQANGHLEAEINSVDPSQTYQQPLQLFWNAGPDQRQGFIPVPLESAGDLALPLVGRGSAFADIDGDGDLDVVVTQTGRQAVLLRNDQDLGHHWLRLKLRGAGGNPDAVGAVAVLKAGGSEQRRTVMPTRSYQSQSESVLTFGLGESGELESLEVIWPDGSTQVVGPLELDRLHVIAKAEARV